MFVSLHVVSHLVESILVESLTDVEVELLAQEANAITATKAKNNCFI